MYVLEISWEEDYRKIVTGQIILYKNTEKIKEIRENWIIYIKIRI